MPLSRTPIARPYHDARGLVPACAGPVPAPGVSPSAHPARPPPWRARLDPLDGSWGPRVVRDPGRRATRAPSLTSVDPRARDERTAPRVALGHQPLEDLS